MFKKTSVVLIVLFSIMLFIGCAAKPNLMPINISYGNPININGLIFVDIIDHHQSVKSKGLRDGKVRDVNEYDITPTPFVSNYLRTNIVNSINLATNGKIANNPSNAKYKLTVEIEHIDYYRHVTMGSFFASQLTIGSLIAKDSYTAEYIGMVEIIDLSNNNVICKQKINQQIDHEHKLNKYYRGVEELLSKMSYKFVQDVLSSFSICFN